MKSKIIKLAKGLQQFTLAEIAMMTEIDKQQTIDIITELEKESRLIKVKEQYQFINQQSLTNTGIQLIEKPNLKPGIKILFKDAAIKFLAECNLSPSTVKGYKSQIFTNLIPYFGKKFLNEITTKDIKEFIEEKQRKLSPKTISNAVTLLGSILKKFYEQGYIKQNPYYGIKNSKVAGQRDKRALSAQEIKSLLEKAEKYSQLHFMIKLCLKTGMKKSEILVLGEDDIQKDKIIINKTFYEGHILAHKNPWEVELPFNFKISQIRNQRLSTITFDNRLRQQFKEITESINIYGLRFDDLILSKEALDEQNETL